MLPFNENYCNGRKFDPITQSTFNLRNKVSMELHEFRCIRNKIEIGKCMTADMILWAYFSSSTHVSL